MINLISGTCKFDMIYQEFISLPEYLKKLLSADNSDDISIGLELLKDMRDINRDSIRIFVWRYNTRISALGSPENMATWVFR